MKHRLFTILSALSLLLFVALLALWAKSYFSADLIVFANSPHPLVVNEWFVRSNYGSLYFARNQHQPGSMMDPFPPVWVSHPPDRNFGGPVNSRPAYFILGPFSIGRTKRHSAFTLPHWSLAALTAVAPLIWLNRFHRSRLTRRRVLNRLCERCGYDLRATPSRCPECGWTPSAPPPPTADRCAGLS